VNRGEQDPVGIVEGVLGAVAVVDVPIDDQHPLQTAIERVGGGDGDGVEEAEAHPPDRGGVVPRRAGQHESAPRPAVKRRVDGGDTGPGGEGGGIDRARGDSGIGIEPATPARGKLAHPGDVARVVNARQGLVGGGAEGDFRAIPEEIAALQFVLDGDETGDVFDVGAGVVLEKHGRTVERRPARCWLRRRVRHGRPSGVAVRRDEARAPSV
jgi:hypothetical protein